MPSDEALAHSPRQGASAQTSYTHITNVRNKAVCNAESSAAFYTGNQEAFVDWLKAASVYHDLGKLEKANQDVLKHESRKPLPIAHEDAGVAALWKLLRKESAVLVAAHHAGLFSKSEESPPNKKRPFRDERQPPFLNGCSIDNHVDVHFNEYLTSHEKAGLGIFAETGEGELHRCGLTRRIALSCLVDADHGDTARQRGHRGNRAGCRDI